MIRDSCPPGLPGISNFVRSLVRFSSSIRETIRETIREKIPNAIQKKLFANQSTNHLKLSVSSLSVTSLCVTLANPAHTSACPLQLNRLLNEFAALIRLSRTHQHKLISTETALKADVRRSLLNFHLNSTLIGPISDKEMN